MSKRDELALVDYLGHIQQAIGRIQRYLAELTVSHSPLKRRNKTRSFAIWRSSVRQRAISNATFPTLPLSIQISRSELLIPFAMYCPTAISRSISMWSGRQKSGICHCLKLRSKIFFRLYAQAVRDLRTENAPKYSQSSLILYLQH